ncbi:MAG: right-handed parallel beta-helix repeat-containing protein [Clostridia bacterium]|nr:right-handed parallel beta-helix repeat-containing protein [Clostridia bacterium]
MNFIRFIVSLFMAIIIPFSNLFAMMKKPADAVFTELEEVKKTERVYEEYEAKSNDIILSDGIGLEEAIEEAKNAGGEEITIWLHEGIYNLSGTVTLDGCRNISFKAFPSEKVEITAVKEIGGFTETTVNGVKAWVTDVESGEKFGTLFNGDQKLSVTRYPESGYFFVKEADRSVALFTKENSPWEYTYGDTAFYSKSDIGLDSFYNIEDVQYKLMHYWYCEHSTLTDYKDGRVAFKQPCSMRIEENDRFFFENVFEALNTAGEWYHDTAKNKVYYIPQDGDDISTTVLTAPILNMIFDIKNCENITFSGIKFKNTDWCFSTPDPSNGWLSEYGLVFPQGNLECNGAMEIQKSQGINFKNCDFLNIGNTGIRFNNEDKNCSVVSCTFKEIGCNGIFINGLYTFDENLTTENFEIVDNLIESYGRNFSAGIGILLTRAKNCKLSHNEIHDGYYTAISCGWMWGYADSATDAIEISDNLIYDIGQGWLSDMGGIYTLGIQPNTVLTHNKIYNVAADPNEGGYGGWGIYLDEGSSYITVKQNLVYGCGSDSFHQHYGENNDVTNNIFALSNDGQIRCTRKEDHNELNLTKNIILTNKQPAYSQTVKGKFKDDGNIYWDLANGKHMMSVAGTGTKWKQRIYKAEMKNMGYYNNAVYADPLFRDAENFDFTLADNSPALSEIGFETWNYNTAGTLTNYR